MQFVQTKVWKYIATKIIISLVAIFTTSGFIFSTLEKLVGIFFFRLEWVNKIFVLIHSILKGTFVDRKYQNKNIVTNG